MGILCPAVKDLKLNLHIQGRRIILCRYGTFLWKSQVIIPHVISNFSTQKSCDVLQLTADRFRCSVVLYAKGLQKVRTLVRPAFSANIY